MKGIVRLMWRKLRLGMVAFVAFAAATLVPPRAQASNPIWINPMQEVSGEGSVAEAEEVGVCTLIDASASGTRYYRTKHVSGP